MSTSDESVTAIEMIDPLVGTIFDQRFRVEERLAAGGFGAIYRATHVKSGHVIALKVLHPTLASDLGVLARFRREGTTLTSLRNPHTITAYEFGQADKVLFIVMELLHGETVFEHYSVNGPMEWKRVVHIAKQVCESLEEAHAQGIVHRDLKPTNIHLENHDGDPDYVKVLDFGIAKILQGSDHDNADITNAGQMIGTLDYMSPEQMVGGQVTGQTDIYTLGILMYEMIAGTRPFPESQNASAALASMLKTTPQPLYLRSPIPRELDAVIMRCLERETQKRYRTVGELRRDLESVVAEAAALTSETALAPKPVFDDDDATTLTPPPEKILELLRTSNADLKTTPRLEALDTPKLEAMQTPKLERVPRPVSEWEDDDEHAATTTRHPDGQEVMPGAPNKRNPTASPIPPLPPVRPFASKHVSTPVPQVVVAPFSMSRTPPPMAPLVDPRPATGQMPPFPQPPVSGYPMLPPTPIPHMIPVTPPMMHGGPPPMPRPPTAGYDMGNMAARETAIRRLVWIVVLIVAAGVGFIVAMQL